MPLVAAVIDVFKSRNNNLNAKQFFSTLTRSKNDRDPVAQIVARRVMQIRRTACKKAIAEERFKNLLKIHATKHKRGGQLPKWYWDQSQNDDGKDEAYPNAQPHPSTNEHDLEWSDDISPLGPIGLLIESVVWHGMRIDDELRIWQRKEEPISIMKVPYQNLKPLILKATELSGTEE